jgi:hypothetical protein
MNEQEKAALAAVTVKDFFQQFGEPGGKYTFELLSILLEELFNAKVVSLLGEPVETRGENSDNLQTRHGQGSELAADESGGIRTPATMEDGSGQNLE